MVQLASDSAAGEMSGQTSESQQAEQAWERAFEALTRAREATIGALTTIQNLREEVNDERVAGKADLEALTEAIGFGLVDAAQAFAEGCQAISEAQGYAQSRGDTERPTSGEAGGATELGDEAWQGPIQQFPKKAPLPSPLEALWPEKTPATD